jgi:hypothetical protein
MKGRSLFFFGVGDRFSFLWKAIAFPFSLRRKGASPLVEFGEDECNRSFAASSIVL